MIAFTKRNLKLYFRDKSAVFFSLLGVIITIGLYLLFLGDVYTGSFEAYEGAREMMDNWEMAGILAVTSLTSAFALFGTMIKDKSDKAMIVRDFYVAPLKRKYLSMGYFFSAYSVGVFMSLFAFIATQAFFFITRGSFISVLTIIKILGMIILNGFTNATMLLFIVSFFHSMNAFSAASITVGTLASFITGIYLPIGMYPEFVQGLVKLFPTSHAAAIFRQLMMKDIMDKMFLGAPESIVQEVKEEFGVVFTLGDNVIPNYVSILYLVVAASIFLVLANINLSRKKK